MSSSDYYYNDAEEWLTPFENTSNCESISLLNNVTDAFYNNNNLSSFPRTPSENSQNYIGLNNHHNFYMDFGSNNFNSRSFQKMAAPLPVSAEEEQIISPTPTETLPSSVYRLQHKKRSMESLYPQPKISTDQHSLLPEIFFPNGKPSKSKKLGHPSNDFGAVAQNPMMSLDTVEGYFMPQVNMASNILGGLDDAELGLGYDSTTSFSSNKCFLDEPLPLSAAPSEVAVPQSSPSSLPTPIVSSLVQTQVVAGNEAGAANVENRLLEENNECEGERRAKRRLTDKSRRAKIKDGLEHLRSLATLSGNQSSDQASVVLSSVSLLKRLVKESQELQSELTALQHAQISYNSILKITQKAVASSNAHTQNIYSNVTNVSGYQQMPQMSRAQIVEDHSVPAQGSWNHMNVPYDSSASYYGQSLQYPQRFSNAIHSSNQYNVHPQYLNPYGA